MRFLSPILLLAAAAAPSPAQQNAVEKPLDAGGRLRWMATATVGPASLAGGAFSSGWGVLTQEPEEYPSNTRGFGQRFGMRLTGVSTANAINVSLGAIWGEDPRYRPAPDRPVGERLNRVISHTFVTHYSDGETRFAWARLTGNVASNSLQNMWRVPSQVGVGPTLVRISMGILGQMTSNAVIEFSSSLFKRRKTSAAPTGPINSRPRSEAPPPAPMPSPGPTPGS